MSTCKWKRIIVPAELRNESGQLLSSATYPRVHLLRSGGVYAGPSINILPDEVVDLEFRAAGSLRSGDFVYVLNETESGAAPPIQSTYLRIETDPTYDPTTRRLMVRIRNMGTETASLIPRCALVLIGAANDYVEHSPTDRGEAVSVTPIHVDQRGRVESYIRTNTCDLKLTANSWANPVYIRNPFPEGRPRLSIADFGAVGDGVTDDTAAIQAALDQTGGLLDGGVVLVPAGIYRVSQTLRVTRRTLLQGDGRHTTIIRAAAAVAMLEAIGTYDGLGVGMLENVEFRDLCFDGNGIATLGVHMRACVLSQIVMCKFTAFLGTHLFLEQVWDVAVDACLFGDGSPSAPDPFVLLDAGEGGTDNTNGIMFTNCRFGAWYYTPVKLLGRGYGGRRNNLIYFVRCQWEASCFSAPFMEVIQTTLLFITSCSFSALRASASANFPGIQIEDSSDVFLTDTHTAYNQLWTDAGDGVAFPDGEDSPSVSGTERSFRTENSAPTSILTFLGGTVGKVIDIHFTDSNTTVHNEEPGAQFSIWLYNQSNTTFVAGDVLRLHLVEVAPNTLAWIEQSRGGFSERPFMYLYNVVGMSVSGGRIIKSVLDEPPIIVRSGESRGYHISGFNIVASSGAPDPDTHWKPQSEYNVLGYEGGSSSYRQNVFNETAYIGAFNREPYLTLERVDSMSELRERWQLGRIDIEGQLQVVHCRDLEGGGVAEKRAMAISAEDSSTELGGRLISATVDGSILVFPAGSSTPSVAAGNVFRTGNSASTTITALSNGKIGQIVTIVFGDKYTTVQNNANIYLKGGVSVLWNTNESVTLLCRGFGSWLEIGRQR